MDIFTGGLMAEIYRSSWERLSTRARWSILAAIGTAPIVRLTILVPVLGALLLFNEAVFGVLQYAQEFLAGVGISPVESRTYSLNQLYFLYVGLSLVGVASLAFALGCPEEIRRHPTRMQYVSSSDVSDNPIIAKSQFERVLDFYIERHGDDGDIKKNKEIEYPLVLEKEFQTLIEEMFNRTPDGVKGNPDEDHPLNDDLYAGAAMYPNIHGIAKLVWSNPKVVWVFTQPFRALAPEFARDIGFVLYATLDHQRFALRILIGTLYLIGFLLVTVPTVTTFVRVVGAIAVGL